MVFLSCGSKPWVPSTWVGDLKELLRVPMRSQGYCEVGRGLSGLHWVWCNGRGPHLEWRHIINDTSVEDFGSSNTNISE